MTTAKLLHRIEEIILRPWPFVRSPSYFGPCRWRHSNPNYTMPWRRNSDTEVDVDAVQQKGAATGAPAAS